MKIKTIGMVGLMGLGGAAFWLSENRAEAHATCFTAECCGAHGYGNSKAGSVFSSCQKLSTIYSRNYSCAPGTICSNAQCGGLRACGQSWSRSSEPHGGNGGHPFHLVSSSCTSASYCTY